MKFIKFFKQSVVVLVLLLVILSPIISLADGKAIPVTPPTKIDNPLGPGGATSLPGLIKNILEGVIKIGIPIVALALIYSGFLFVAAQGNPEKLKKAKSALMFTLIGATILLGSWALAQLISETVLAL